MHRAPWNLTSNLNRRQLEAKVGTQVGLTCSAKGNPKPKITWKRRDRKRLRVNGQGDLIYQALRNKEGKNVQLELYRPQTFLRGIIENVSAPVEEVSVRGSVTVYCLVRFRGSKIFTVSSSSTTLGTGLLGVERLG